ncbi:hypothetical protein [Vibrio sp.]|uniref:hypothetical protein n=1 Tax=Vibrio sp. TaxID=678 RepID=UPI00311F4AEE
MRLDFSDGDIYIVGTVLFTVISQLIIKWRMSSVFNNIPNLISDRVLFFLKVFSDPFIIISLASIFCSGIFWMIAMTKFELSSAYPIVVAGLMLTTSFISIILFGEDVNLCKILGILVSLLGILILYMGQK